MGNIVYERLPRPQNECDNREKIQVGGQQCNSRTSLYKLPRLASLLPQQHLHVAMIMAPIIWPPQC